MFIGLCRKRDLLQKFLNSKGIQTLVYYGTPLHLHPASKKFGYKIGDFPKAEAICNKVLAFPHHQHLKKKHIEFVCDTIKLPGNNVLIFKYENKEIMVPIVDYFIELFDFKKKVIKVKNINSLLEI